MATPLTDLTFNLLLVLAGEELHGYGLVMRLRTFEGYEALRTGTVYAALARLLDEGFIEEVEEPGAPDEDERRRYYRVSSEGRQAARAEALRRERALGLARQKELLPGREHG